ncbi:MAG TPA: sugar phosphate isomerase/epimerase family protein [Candidatus Limnocylindrales bacterium]|nr:sugar phosphate isomerase/epimerase family protein [Candidatus Limnocylindrales bacterium]
MKRREFVAGGVTAALLSAMPGRAANLKQFRLGVITDEVTQDFEKALLWAKGFGLEWVELRIVWNKYVVDFTSDDVKRAKDLLAKHGMKISVVDSPYFKTLLPGTESKFADPKGDPLQSDFSKQQAVLEHAIARAKDFGTDKVRVFSFLRVADPKSVFERVAKELEKTAAIAQREGIRLVLENEFSCNVATGVESAALLDAVKSPALGLNWDPGNAYAAGETPFPDGYAPIDKKRIWHMHLKDAAPPEKGQEAKWMPIGSGKIDYLGQFRAVLKNGYEGTMSLETHYLNAAKDKEASSRESMEGLLKVIKEA